MDDFDGAQARARRDAYGLESAQSVAVAVPDLSDEMFCRMWQEARGGVPEGMCGHVQVRQFGKLLYAYLGINAHGPWPQGGT